MSCSFSQAPWLERVITLSGELLRQPLGRTKDKGEATVTVLSNDGLTAIVGSTTGIAILERGHHRHPTAAGHGFGLRQTLPTTQLWRREAGVDRMPAEVERRCARRGHERRRRRSRAMLPPVTTDGVSGGFTGNGWSLTP